MNLDYFKLGVTQQDGDVAKVCLIAYLCVCTKNRILLRIYTAVCYLVVESVR